MDTTTPSAAQATLAAIYEAHAPALQRYFATRLRDASLAEDLCADVFCEVAAKLPRYEDRGKPITGWLYQIAHSRLVDHIRRHTARPTTPLDTEHASSDAVEDTVIAQLDRETVRAALATLPPPQREIIALRFTANLPAAAVAARLGMTTGAVKATQHRAIVALQRTLGATI